ncbi:hypothetical protein [Micromonospora sp. NPDC005305]|uniref:hypothetical protein n=1 Tax=Micromonospora sp. NPDC005305 TaxID=3156875 RepID=UPI00339ED1FF
MKAVRLADAAHELARAADADGQGAAAAKLREALTGQYESAQVLALVAWSG